MKIVVFGPDKRVGVLLGNSVVDASLAYAKYLYDTGRHGVASSLGAVVPASLSAYIEAGRASLEATRLAVAHIDATIKKTGPAGETIVHALDETVLHAPRPDGSRVACIGGNFADHAAAMYRRRGHDYTGDPAQIVREVGMWGFWKIDRQTTPPGGSVTYPSQVTRLDYEGEVAIVLAKKGKNIPAADWRSYVWGVTILGDWSIRDQQNPRCAFKLAKNFDGSTSMGPCILVDEKVDPGDLVVETFVNGERRQSFNTRQMVFTFGEYLAYLSSNLTLFPGDIVSCATGAGTAADSSPILEDGTQSKDRYLKAGDTIEIVSPLIGSLKTAIVS